MGTTVALAGCAGDDDSENGDSGDGESTTNTETLHDSKIFTDKRWPHEFSPGDILNIEMSIEEGGPGLFVINRPEDDVLDRTRVEVSEEFTHEIEFEGRYYLSVAANGTANVLVELQQKNS